VRAPVPEEPVPEQATYHMAEPELVHRSEDGRALPLHVWRFDEPVRAIASGPLGGGLGDRHWVINASVHKGYSRHDPDAHLTQLAADLRLSGPGVGLLTAVNVRDAVAAEDGGVRVVTTVGLGYPTWAAAPPDPDGAEARVGTINIVALVPALLSDAALVNAVATVTEAKVQALCERGVEATGTATDALFVGCVASGVAERFGGPRSTWGSRLARAVYDAVNVGIVRWSARSGR
jgi:adenosylcobinamide hydrolase